MGVDSNGIGFGNLSVRDGETNSFYITGSGTGGMEELKLEHCAKVTAFDFGRNWLRCEGSTIASSESLTHAAVYESDPNAAAAIHGHDLELWAALLDQVPTTGRGVEYGTPAMADEVRRLFKMTDVKSRKIFVMAGHEGGVVAFGKDAGGSVWCGHVRPWEMGADYGLEIGVRREQPRNNRGRPMAAGQRTDYRGQKSEVVRCQMSQGRGRRPLIVI